MEIGLILLGAAALFALAFPFILWEYIQDIRSQSWPKVNAKIISSRDVVKSEGRDIMIEYQYEVDGKAYIGKSSRNKYEKSDQGKKYHVGADLEVYYDPKRPKASKLDITRF